MRELNPSEVSSVEGGMNFLWYPLIIVLFPITLPPTDTETETAS